MRGRRGKERQRIKVERQRERERRKAISTHLPCRPRVRSRNSWRLPWLAARTRLFSSRPFSQGGFHQTTAALEHPSRYSREVVANKQSPREDTRDRGGGALAKRAKKKKKKEDLLLPYLIITNPLGAERRYYGDLHAYSGFTIKNTQGTLIFTYFSLLYPGSFSVRRFALRNTALMNLQST